MMQTTFEERQTFCNKEFERVKKVAEANNLWFILICRTNTMSKELSSHVYYFEKRMDYEDSLEHLKFKYEQLKNKLGISYWIDHNEDFVNGGMFDDYKRS